MGDPSGIGPEISLKAVSDPAVLAVCRPFVAGDEGVLRRDAALLGLELPFHVAEPSASPLPYREGHVNVIRSSRLDLSSVRHGEVVAASGDAAFQAVRTVIELAMDDRLDATVTAPIHKESINLAGHRYAGHTEIYADLTGTDHVAMLLADGDFRVIQVTTHVSLRRACDLITEDRVLRVIELLHGACLQFGEESPRLAVCGLNPHASDGGLFGDEEERHIIPAIRAAQAKGILAEGPFAADTIMSKVAGGFYAGVVAMYHDQGHIPFKLKGFVWDREKGAWGDIRGVNITLGIPIIRVSVDHGTAFDIAGRGIASCESLKHALEYAVRMSRHRISARTP